MRRRGRNRPSGNAARRTGWTIERCDGREPGGARPSHGCPGGDRRRPVQVPLSSPPAPAAHGLCATESAGTALQAWNLSENPMKELTAAMSLLLAIATCLAVFAAARPTPDQQPRTP